MFTQAAWCFVKYPEVYLAWIHKHPFLEASSFTHFFGPAEIVYMPDALKSGRWICTEVDYTHIGSRARRGVVARAVPGVNPDGWRKVAQLTDIFGKPVTNLTAMIVDSSGADQMSMVQTLTFFSMQASSFHKYIERSSK